MAESETATMERQEEINEQTNAPTPETATAAGQDTSQSAANPQQPQKPTPPPQPVIKTIDDLVIAAWKKGDPTIVVDGSLGVRFTKLEDERLKKERIRYEILKDGKYAFTRKRISVKEAPMTHKYIMPSFSNEVECLIDRALARDGMANILLSGPMGTGKTEFVYELARRKQIRVYQVNGSEGLTSQDFFGAMSVGIDPKSQQNFTYFEKGPLYRAFIEGTKLDEEGHQVLDEKGEPIVIGNPAFFFLDEFAAMLPEVFLGVFNRALEIPRTHGKGRSIEISLDNGRIVKSHPGLVIFLAGNTVGAGNSGRYQMGYTAQGNKMDESTRNRITGVYQFGYSKKAEESIALGLLNDDRQVANLLKFRDEMRTHFRNDEVETIVSTRSIVSVCELANTFRSRGLRQWMEKALKGAIYSGLPEQDKTLFNEKIRTIWGVDADFMSQETSNMEYDYM